MEDNKLPQPTMFDEIYPLLDKLPDEDKLKVMRYVLELQNRVSDAIDALNSFKTIRPN